MTYEAPNGTRFDSLSGRAAALNRWALIADPSAATKPARSAFLARFERLVDPDGTLPEEERIKRAERAMKAHMTSLALKSRSKRSR